MAPAFPPDGAGRSGVQEGDAFQSAHAGDVCLIGFGEKIDEILVPVGQIEFHVDLVGLVPPELSEIDREEFLAWFDRHQPDVIIGHHTDAIGWLADRGLRATESHANFIFVNLGIPARQFRDGCAAKNVRVGRDFPPFEKSWCRISIGTMDEMKAATAVFGEVLGKGAIVAA